MQRSWCAALAVLTAAACDKQIVVGSDLPGDAGEVESKDATSLKDATPDARDKDAAATKDATKEADATDAGGDAAATAFVVPWTTGFENDNFNDWLEPQDGGYCYELGGTYSIVTTPVHTGNYAAAFTVNPNASALSQARCVRQGVLPASAYYGAWYYVPVLETNDGGNWNLFHFQGADPPNTATENLWDLSLINEKDGAVQPSVYDFKRGTPHDMAVTIPIGTWFHLEVRLTRSSGNTGEFTVYVDGTSVLDLTGIETDDTTWGQWYVGNYASTIAPSPATVYVDDVTIETTGP